MDADREDRIIEFVGDYAIVERFSKDCRCAELRYVVWKYMPRVDEHIRTCVVYLYPSEKDAREARELGGTGFLVSLRSESRRAFTYVVTNRHVVEEYGARFTRINWREAGKAHDVFEGEWVYHSNPRAPKRSKGGDDIAACEFFKSIADYEFAPVHITEFVTPTIVKDLQIGVGEDLFITGRFLNHAGKARNLPTVRFGTIAMMLDEPIDDDGYPQDSLLAEIHTGPGYSGSPVFVHVPSDRLKNPNVKATDNDRKWAANTGFIDKCLGIEWSRLKGEKVKQMTLNNIDYTIYVPTGMSGVIPAWKIAELLNCRKFQMQRDKIDNPTIDRSESRIEHTGATLKQKQKRKNRDIEIPPISHEKFFADLAKATKRRTS